MTFTFIIMDSLYIMRNLLILFCLMVVFWTNLGNCAGSCDNNTQCHYNESRVNSTVNCTIETAGNTIHPCYGHGSKVTCSCHSENYQLSSPNNSYLCRPDEWEDGLYDLHCLTDICDTYTQCRYNETRMHSTVSCDVETAGNTAPPCYGHGSIITCSCKSENYQLSSPNNSYLCRPGEWEDGLYDLHCLTASSCDEPAPPDDLVSHSPDFAEGEMYANGTEIIYDCPEGWDLNGHMTAVCLYGVWTYEDAYCTATTMTEVPTTTSITDNTQTSPATTMTEVPTTISTTDSPPQCCVVQFLNGRSSASCLCVKWILTTVPRCFAAVVIIAISTLLFVVLLIWLVKKHCLRRGTKWIPSVGDVANKQEPPTANDESKFVSKITFEMSDPNGYQNDVNKEENDVTDDVGDNSPGDSSNNDPEEETV